MVFLYTKSEKYSHYDTVPDLQGPVSHGFEYASGFKYARAW